jgi:hypothetical protein
MIDGAVVSGDSPDLEKKLAQLNGHEMKITDPMLNFTYELRGYQKQIFGWSSVTTSLF